LPATWFISAIIWPEKSQGVGFRDRIPNIRRRFGIKDVMVAQLKRNWARQVAKQGAGRWEHKIDNWRTQPDAAKVDSREDGFSLLQT